MSKALAIYRKTDAPTQPMATRAPDREIGWMDQGACRKYDPELWYPLASSPSRRVVEICLSCPVQLRCLDYAWNNGILHGIWGGAAAEARHCYKTTGQPPRHWLREKEGGDG